VVALAGTPEAYPRIAAKLDPGAAPI
jgi:hypothetical protein